jgi:molybdopterin-guanine dinucleotide biosynthesis protein B
MAGKPAVIGVCGYSNSGKTLLLEQLVPRLAGRSLRVAVIKSCGEPVEADRPGKDTDRLFAAGADVMANGPNEAFLRLHAGRLPLEECLRRLPDGYDLVLVEGFRQSDIPKLRLDDLPDEHLLLRIADPEADLDAAEEAILAYLGDTP